MKRETKEWVLELIPKYVLKKVEFQEVVCYYCEGTGYNHDEYTFGIGSLGNKCDFCNASGKIKKQIPPTEEKPQIDISFIEYMKNAFRNYEFEK